MRKIILAIITLIAGFIFYVVHYVGYFREVLVSLEERGPIYVVAKAHTGSYYKIVPIIEEVETWAKSNKLDCRFSFGQYFDDPTRVEDGRQRSRGGCLVDSLEGLPPLPEGFSAEQIPHASYVKALFEGSPSIGPLKVYPKMMAFMTKEKLSAIDWGVIEIYEVKGPKAMTTTYLFPVRKL